MKFGVREQEYLPDVMNWRQSINERIKWAHYLCWAKIKYCHWATSQNEIWAERASLARKTETFRFISSHLPSFLPSFQRSRARASGSGRPIVQTPAKREAGSRDAGAVKDSFGHSLEVKGQAREGQTRASPTCWDKWRNTGISRAWRMTSLRSCKDHAIRLVGKLPLWVGTKQKYVCTTTVCLHDIMIQTQSVWSGENEVWQFSDSEPHARELHEMHSLRDCGLGDNPIDLFSLKINRSCGNLRDRALH